MPFSAGMQVGPYRIMEQLGQGGMATVYKAYHPSLDRYVAIKVLHQAFLEDSNFLARFQREARVVARLEHPNIVPVYDYAEHEGQPYLVMKFIEGETLKARLQRGPLTATDVEYIVVSVGAGLSYAHKQGILHRDIKPSNVINTKDGQVYLADFGLARIAQSGESTLTSDMVLGTPQYISPEQAMAKKDLDEGTDIYSFGVMLYEMTVGRVPFSADTPFSVIHDHIYTPLPLPRSVNPNISPELERVLLKALSKERSDRYKDVAGMVSAFKEAWTSSASTLPFPAAVPAPEAGAATSAGSSAPLTLRVALEAAPPPPAAPGSPATQPQKPQSRWRWMWIPAVLVLCLCCLVILLALQGRKPPTTGLSFTATPRATDAGLPLAAPLAEPSEEPPVDLPLISVDQAKQQVDQNPRDPKAHLVYGYALIKNGQDLAGYEQIKKGAVLAGRNQLLLLGSAKTLENQGVWLGAAILYMQMAENPREMSNLLITNLHQAVYIGFSNPHAPEVLKYDAIGKVDQALALMAQARYVLTNQHDYMLAQSLIDKLNALAPDMRDTDLLRAELFIDQKNYQAAKKVLQGLIDAPNIPLWIQTQAEILLNTIP